MTDRSSIRSVHGDDQSDGAATAPSSPIRDTADGNRDAGSALAPTEASVAPTVERDAARPLDMKEPSAEAEQTASLPRSILHAVSEPVEVAVNAVVEAQPTTNEDDDEEDLVPPRHGEKGVQYTLSELFINPNLKLKSANAVLRKDPFAIPRATDNVTEYRPRFNPLSILVSEEKLLPRDFKFDFSEGIPGEPTKAAANKGKTLGKRAGKELLPGRASRSNSDFDASSLLVRKPYHVAPICNPQVFGDKLATMGLLMGSMPRQPQTTPTPLINTPTVHNPFGDTVLGELVANDAPQSSEYVALQRLRAATAPELPLHQQQLHHQAYDQELLPPQSQPQPPVVLAETLGAEFDAFGVDLHNISNLSKLSIAATAADTTGAFHAGTLPPLTPPASAGLYDGLTNYLPSHFAEKRGPQLVMDPALYEVAPYHAAEYPADGYQHPDYSTMATTTYATTPAHSDYASQQQQQGHDRDSMDSSYSQSLQPINKKPRSKNVFRACTHPGCAKGARGKSGLCQKHGGGKRCATPNCPKGAQGSSKFCLFHGGGYRCTHPGCTTGARGTSGLCAKHGGYKRAREGSGHGDEEIMGEEHERGGGGLADKKPRMESYEGRALEATG